MTTARFRRTLSTLGADDVVLAALEIRHPAITDPVRVVSHTTPITIGRHRYDALGFMLRLADDVEGRAPSAELVLDNVGRDLTQWIERAGGAAGATCRVMLVLAARRAIEWEAVLDVLHVRYDDERVTVTLGYDPLLDRDAVAVRYDPETAPGLFGAATAANGPTGGGGDVDVDPPPPPPPPSPAPGSSGPSDDQGESDHGDDGTEGGGDSASPDDGGVDV